MAYTDSAVNGIALEWLKQQDLSKLSPAETYQKWISAKDEIAKEVEKRSKDSGSDNGFQSFNY